MREGLGLLRRLTAAGEALRAQAVGTGLLERHPDDPGVLFALAQLWLACGDVERAMTLYARGRDVDPVDLGAALEMARQLWTAGDLQRAQVVLEEATQRHVASTLADTPALWLVLGELRQVRGDDDGAARAWHQAGVAAKARGQWQHESTTPEPLRPLIRRAGETARAFRRNRLRDACTPLRDTYGTLALQRVDRAVDALTAATPLMPADVRQRPKFWYFPDLPSEPYLDPYLVPWARRLADAYDDMRGEALALLESGEPLPSFLPFDPGERLGDYLGGNAAKPAWDAFFFYRHGERYEHNHRRCPRTSAVLESLELFRIRGQAPEICFSFLAPQTTIQPHYGVSNTRLVMHLPLLVPPRCALNLVGVGEHHWREGELLLFDDTYLHEAWNRSDQMRIVLLMDCWNPRLTEVEQRAVAAVIEASSDFDRAV